VFLGDKVSTIGLKEKIGIKLVTEVIKRDRFRWLGHVLWKEDGD